MPQTSPSPWISESKCETTLKGRTIAYTLKRSPRAKHVRLEVRRETGLTVVIPRSYNVARLSSLLEAKWRWISVKLAQWAAAQPLSEELKNGGTIPYLGEELKVVIERDCGSSAAVKLQKNKLLVSSARASGELNSLLERWYRRQAEKLMKERASELSSKFGLTYNRLFIRGQRTRWGSCSRKGNLSFNWKLLMAPEWVIDYVVIHELTHLDEMNHRKRFWELVAQRCPRWREHKKWLKEHQAEFAARLSPPKRN